MRVLLLVAESWRLDNSGGNTLNNFFDGMDGVEFAQIYCSDSLPQNSICKKYYQISQSEVIKGFLLHKKVGHALEERDYSYVPEIVQLQAKVVKNQISLKEKFFRCF